MTKSGKDIKSKNGKEILEKKLTENEGNINQEIKEDLNTDKNESSIEISLESENDNEDEIESSLENVSEDNSQEQDNSLKHKKCSTVAELRKEMAKLGLSLKGNKDDLKKRYKKYIKKQEEKEKNKHKQVEKIIQPYKYYCIIDYEATCDVDGGFDYPNEIIEFPAILVRSYTNEIESEFHEYVKPTNNPILTDYCKKLTGITQEQIDNADVFTVVLEKFEKWLGNYSTYPFNNICFVTDGPWDIRDFIRKQCEFSNINRPPYFHHWINLRALFKCFYKTREWKNLNGMLSHLNMTFEGHEHCGLDDTRNITRIVQCMLKASCIFKKNISV